ncbi:MAG: V-type ATP synthase subunit E [Candidatus Thorarchaeota archaeon]|jgi:V/A-type H+-transporting ATPase subunit E
MSGITNIVDMIEEKTEEKVQTIIKEAESQKKQVLDAASKKAETVEQGIIQKAEVESKAELSRQEASAKLQSKYKILEAKEAVLKQVLEEAEANLVKETKGKNYGTVLTQLAVAGGVALEDEKIELILPKGHDSHITPTAVAKAISDAIGKKVTATVSKETVRATGGIIVRTKDGTRWVDNTFEARMERFEKKIRDEVSSMLFVEKE